MKYGENLVIFENFVTTKEENITIGDNVRIDSNVKLEGGEILKIGSNIHIASGCHFNAGGGWLFIEDDCGFAGGVSIVTGQPDLNFEEICPNSLNFHEPIRKVTMLGRGVFVGTKAIILPGVRIDDFGVVGAGSLVTRNIGKGEVWYGNPAKFVKMRWE